MEQFVIAIDAMGGDEGPNMVLPGIDLALSRHRRLKVLLFGDEAVLAPIMQRYPALKARCEVRHTPVSVAMDAKPSEALRKGRKVSSMWLAIEAVGNGEADVAVSAGNTGALMAMAKFALRTMPGIKRPAIAGLWPNVTGGQSVVLDIGATIGADAEQLVDYAIMGEAMARCVLGIERPSVGLLNVGVEEIKGVEYVKAAGRMLRSSGLPISYHGFVEGNDLGKGTVDVFVTEGFSGNIAVKTAEGTVSLITTVLRQAIDRSLIAKFGCFLARSAFSQLRERLDPRNSNGGVFLGLNGIVVKSHGGTDPVGFANSITIAMSMARNQIVDKIAADLAEKQTLTEAENAKAAPATEGS